MSPLCVLFNPTTLPHIRCFAFTQQRDVELHLKNAHGLSGRDIGRRRVRAALDWWSVRATKRQIGLVPRFAREVLKHDSTLRYWWWDGRMNAFRFNDLRDFLLPGGVAEDEQHLIHPPDDPRNSSWRPERIGQDSRQRWRQLMRQMRRQQSRRGRGNMHENDNNLETDDNSDEGPVRRGGQGPGSYGGMRAVRRPGEYLEDENWNREPPSLPSFSPICQPCDGKGDGTAKGDTQSLSSPRRRKGRLVSRPFDDESDGESVGGRTWETDSRRMHGGRPEPHCLNTASPSGPFCHDCTLPLRPSSDSCERCGMPENETVLRRLAVMQRRTVELSGGTLAELPLWRVYNQGYCASRFENLLRQYRNMCSQLGLNSRRVLAHRCGKCGRRLVGDRCPACGWKRNGRSVERVEGPHETAMRQSLSASLPPVPHSPPNPSPHESQQPQRTPHRASAPPNVSPREQLLRQIAVLQQQRVTLGQQSRDRLFFEVEESHARWIVTRATYPGWDSFKEYYRKCARAGIPHTLHLHQRCPRCGLMCDACRCSMTSM
uniref:Uncharacterized protein n=1 Tax=Chromera velia CCMP2878 TaxID=1169474 RepID=A0A0G4HYE0_9ALVE|eukprot:Cvel_33555.t1-p1 / transcript=Cvel_33555.t1 / gene=Cvel_33555 / organism=Chromera_velia_CCMP2878 / gene_product=hypothetical protein / transcript_product=hypothetical protein / location=Cvel_scaffold5479:108-2432(+) / protein_length=544 / sequence_SO=supercontig / SO=protein_coding / is_pseudo=false